MLLPTKDDVRPILRDFELRIRAILEAAWDEWMEMPNRSRFSSRTRASAVFDFIKRRALEEFEGDRNIRAIPKGQTVHFLFRDRVLVRFKKANGSGLGSNIETQAVLEFIDHELTIPDLLPDIYRVEVCYHLDELATNVSRIAVTARQQHKRLWSYEVEQPTAAEVEYFPSPPDGDIPPPVVRVRKSKTDDAKTDDSKPGE